jgi:hypothetical protein
VRRPLTNSRLLSAIFAFVAVLRAYYCEAQPIHFLDVRRVDQQGLQLMQTMQFPAVERAAEIEWFPPMRIPPEGPYFSTPVSFVSLDAAALMQVGNLDLLEIVYAAPSWVSIQVAGKRERMALIERIFDPAFRAFHLTFLSPMNSSLMRVTVSTIGQEVVGTLERGNQTFLVLPMASTLPAQQAVYAERQYFSAHGPISSVDRDTRVGSLVTRHLQMERIAEIQPQEFQTLPSGVLSRIRGGDLGFLDIANESDSAAESENGYRAISSAIAAYINSRWRLTSLANEIAVRVVSISTSHEQGTVEFKFRQTIDDIPFASLASITTTEDGRVLAISGHFYDAGPHKWNRADWISLDVARSIAVDAVRAQTESVRPHSEFEELQLETSPGDDFYPIWRFVISINSRSPRMVTVNPLDGSVDIDE